MENADSRWLDDWQTAIQTLASMLKDDGSVSSKALRKELEHKGVNNARELAVKLWSYDFDGENDSRTPRPDFRYYHKGRSFFTESAYQEAVDETAAEADEASLTEADTPSSRDDEAPRRPNKQEEARLVTYVKDALLDLYDSEHTPNEAPYVFDVHNARAGSDFENIDLITLHWRSSSTIDIVTVEVKLGFHARLVQQANNYRRFSNRVWIAAPCSALPHEAAQEFRETDPLLFDFTVEAGLGILACRRAKGRSYEVFPVQWPRRLEIDPAERDALIGRHRSVFEEAHAVDPRPTAQYPTIR